MERKIVVMDMELRNNLIPSTGCTEPIAIANASAVAAKYLEEKPSAIKLYISKNIAKNAMDAGVPNSKYNGAAFVAALGALYANPDDGFQLLEGLSPEKHDEAYKFSEKNVTIKVVDTEKPLYIEVRIQGRNTERCCKCVTVIVADKHDNIQTIKVDGEEIFNSSSTTDSKETSTNGDDFCMGDIFKYVENTEDFSLVERAILLNMSLSEKGLGNEWGLNVGKVTPFDQETKVSRILSVTASAIDARMAGADAPAMACTGSGNQGITATLPVYQFGLEMNMDRTKILKAVTVSALTTIYVKKNLNVLSYLCGATIASCGAAAGMTYLLGGNYVVAEYAVKNVLASVAGMFCDGAKSSCAMKVLACTNMAVYAAHMAINENGRITQKVGVARATLEKTIEVIAGIEQKTINIMDEAIIEGIV